MCFEGVTGNPIFLGIIAICSLAAFVMVWMLKFQKFHGKIYYALAFGAMIWTLSAVGLEVASSTYTCQLLWATLAWPGNALVPIAWCFFVFAYIENPAWLNKRKVGAALVFVPTAIFALAVTNPWHNLVYTEASLIPQGASQINYVHGPAFHGIIATLYVFVFSTLFCLLKAFFRAKPSAWPLLTMLVVITITPLAGNAAYVGFGVTVFGMDPTAFMFTIGILAFTWLLTTNKTMDMAAVGESILFDTMSEPVILIDRHYKVAQMNSAAKRSALFLEADCPAQDMIARLATTNSSDVAISFVVGELTYEPRIQKIESPLDPDGPVLGWSITFVDVTERIAITAALEEALRRADEASHAKDDFISVISHELRTPLTSLKGGLALALSGRLGELAPPIRSSLEIASRGSVRLSKFIDNLLLAQKVNTVALTLENKPLDLGRLLEESFEENRAFASEQGVHLAKVQTDQSVVILGDAFAIRQILDNLVSNAIKFSNEHGIVEGTLKITGDRVRLSIKDTGEGIPEGMEARVFARFGQVQSSKQGSTQGTGLGLHISKKLVEQMSGDIFYESRVGLGTTFHISFCLEKHQSGEPALLVG